MKKQRTIAEYITNLFTNRLLEFSRLTLQKKTYIRFDSEGEKAMIISDSKLELIDQTFVDGFIQQNCLYRLNEMSTHN